MSTTYDERLTNPFKLFRIPVTIKKSSLSKDCYDGVIVNIDYKYLNELDKPYPINNDVEYYAPIENIDYAVRDFLNFDTNFINNSQVDVIINGKLLPSKETLNNSITYNHVEISSIAPIWDFLRPGLNKQVGYFNILIRAFDRFDKVISLVDMCETNAPNFDEPFIANGMILSDEQVDFFNYYGHYQESRVYDRCLPIQVKIDSRFLPKEVIDSAFKGCDNPQKITSPQLLRVKGCIYQGKDNPFDLYLSPLEVKLHNKHFRFLCEITWNITSDSFLSKEKISTYNTLIRNCKHNYIALNYNLYSDQPLSISNDITKDVLRSIRLKEVTGYAYWDKSSMQDLYERAKKKADEDKSNAFTNNTVATIPAPLSEIHYDSKTSTITTLDSKSRTLIDTMNLSLFKIYKQVDQVKHSDSRNIEPNNNTNHNRTVSYEELPLKVNTGESINSTNDRLKEIPRYINSNDLISRKEVEKVRVLTNMKPFYTTSNAHEPVSYSDLNTPFNIKCSGFSKQSAKLADIIYDGIHKWVLYGDDHYEEKLSAISSEVGDNEWRKGVLSERFYTKFISESGSAMYAVARLVPHFISEYPNRLTEKESKRRAARIYLSLGLTIPYDIIEPNVKYFDSFDVGITYIDLASAGVTMIERNISLIQYIFSGKAELLKAPNTYRAIAEMWSLMERPFFPINDKPMNYESAQDFLKKVIRVY